MDVGAGSPGTVTNRIENALFKLEAGRRIEAVTKAMQQQIIRPLCIALAGLIAMHAAIDDSDPIRGGGRGGKQNEHAAMSKRKQHNMRARLERTCPALVTADHAAVANIDPSGKQVLINWKNLKQIRVR